MVNLSVFNILHDYYLCCNGFPGYTVIYYNYTYVLPYYNLFIWMSGAVSTDGEAVLKLDTG